MFQWLVLPPGIPIHSHSYYLRFSVSIASTSAQSQSQRCKFYFIIIHFLWGPTGVGVWLALCDLGFALAHPTPTHPKRLCLSHRRLSCWQNRELRRNKNEFLCLPHIPALVLCFSFSIYVKYACRIIHESPIWPFSPVVLYFVYIYIRISV